MEENVIKNIQEINDKRSKQQILAECINELAVDKKSLWHLILSIALSVVASFLVAFFSNTVAVTKEIVSVLLDVALAFFAVILGAYSVFQALMRDEIIKELIKTSNNILKESNRTFLNLSILYVMDIFVTVILYFVTNICPEDFYLWNILLSNVLFMVFFLVYLTFNFMLILENVNFVINLYRMFNVYNIYRALDVLDKDNQNED